MNILLVYATYSGGTQIASEFITDLLKEKGHQVTVVRVDKLDPSQFDGAHDLIILGTPSWMEEKQDGQPHHYFFDFMNKWQDKRLDGKKFAIFGLGDKDFARFTHGVDVLTEFLTTRGGTITTEPLRLDSFQFKYDESEAKLTEWTSNLVANS